MTNRELDKRTVTLAELLEVLARGLNDLKQRQGLQEQQINLLTIAVQELAGDSVAELAEARDFAAEHAETCQLEDLYGKPADADEAAEGGAL